MTPTLVNAASANHKNYALFEIETDIGPQYMRVERSAGSDEERMVIVVDSSRFLRTWKHKLASGDRYTWADVPGIAEVQKRFSASKRRPVRLPRVEIKRNMLVALWLRIAAIFRLAKATPSRDIAIVEGERRTIWLLAHGAATFPLECTTRCASELHQLIGVAGIPPASVESLTSTR